MSTDEARPSIEHLAWKMYQDVYERNEFSGSMSYTSTEYIGPNLAACVDGEVDFIALAKIAIEEIGRGR